HPPPPVSCSCPHWAALHLSPPQAPSAVTLRRCVGRGTEGLLIWLGFSLGLGLKRSFGGLLALLAPAIALPLCQFSRVDQHVRTAVRNPGLWNLVHFTSPDLSGYKGGRRVKGSKVPAANHSPTY